MSALLITYDLNSPGQKYDALHEEIKALGAWWLYMESTWIVVTARTPQEAFAQLNKHVDGTDRALVVDITGQKYSGWLTDAAWEWLRKHVGPLR
jgi:hypothetical protein